MPERMDVSQIVTLSAAADSEAGAHLQLSRRAERHAADALEQVHR